MTGPNMPNPVLSGRCRGKGAARASKLDFGHQAAWQSA